MFLLFIGSSICGFVLWKLIFFFWDYLHHRSIINKIPGPPDIILLGNVHTFERDPALFYQQILNYSKMYEKHPFYRVWLGTQSTIVCHTAKPMEFLLTNTIHINKALFYKFLQPWLGNGLLLARGSQWKIQRKMLTPAFHFNILKDFVPIFNEQGNILVDILAKYADTGEAIDVFPLIKLAALDIICETAMGKFVNCQRNGCSDYVNAIFQLAYDATERAKSPWLYLDFIYRFTKRGRSNTRNLKIVHKFRTEIIQEKKFKLSQKKMETFDLDEDKPSFSKKRRLAFLDLLLEYQANNRELTDENIGDQVDTFIFEGHDTTSVALSWTLYLLGRHPYVQEKVHQELDQFLSIDDNDTIKYSDLSNLPYLEQVIKESLRLYPPVPFIGRRLEEDISLCGYNLPKGTDVVLFFSALQRNKDIFANPDEFIPERFDVHSPDKERRNPFSYLPFSAGSRNCIGAKFANIVEKIILASILRKFRVESTQEESDVAPSMEVILRPSKGIHVKLFNRG